MMSDYISTIIQRYQAELQKVKRDGWALEFVKEQTPEICLAAVNSSEYALRFVKEEFKYLFDKC